MKKVLFFSAFCLVMLTSCDAFLQGMAQGLGGYGGYGGYGMGGTTLTGGYYIGSTYCPPLTTQSVQQAAQMVQQQAAQNMVETAKQAQQVRSQIEAQAAYDVQHGIVPVVVDNSSPTIQALLHPHQEALLTLVVPTKYNTVIKIVHIVGEQGDAALVMEPAFKII